MKKTITTLVIIGLLVSSAFALPNAYTLRERTIETDYELNKFNEVPEIPEIQLNSKGEIVNVFGQIPMENPLDHLEKEEVPPLEREASKEKEHEEKPSEAPASATAQNAATTLASTASTQEATPTQATVTTNQPKEEPKPEPKPEPNEPISPVLANYSMDQVGIYHNGQGAVTVTFPNAPAIRLRVLVEKGGERAAYNLHDGTKTADAVATFPLNMGNGTYVVRIMENTEGNSYREVYRKEVKLDVQKHAEFLNSVQEINWKTSDPAIQHASRLTAGMSNDMDKVRAVYNYVSKNISYDHDKVSQINHFYLPNINDTFSTKKGICYDYASLTAAMLRSQGIPTRLVKGYAPGIDVYHAWNEVYIASQDRWITIDATVGGEMIKNSSGYTVHHRI